MRRGALLPALALMGVSACHDGQSPTASAVPNPDVLQQRGQARSNTSAMSADAPWGGALGPARIQDYPGDHPLVTRKVVSGRVDALVLVVPHVAAADPSGTFTVVGVPAGATVRAAFFVTTSFSASATEAANVTFAGQSLGARGDRLTDPAGGLYCRAYPYDVTSIVTGNGTYAYSVTGTSNTYGDALVIVFEEASLPLRRLAINFGSEALAGFTSTTNFAAFGAGSGRLLIFTQADNPDPGATETVSLNGAVIAGPGDIFNGNQGSFASLQDLSVNLSAGTNTVDVSTPSDFFGLHLAILIGPPGKAL